MPLHYQKEMTQLGVWGRGILEDLRRLYQDGGADNGGRGGRGFGRGGGRGGCDGGRATTVVAV